MNRPFDSGPTSVLLRLALLLRNAREDMLASDEPAQGRVACLLCSV